MLNIQSVAQVLHTNVAAVRKAIKDAGIEASSYNGKTALFNSDAIDKIKAALEGKKMGSDNNREAKELLKIAKELIANDKFFNAYVTAALWSSTDDDDDPLDDNYDMRDIAPEALHKMQADCKKFQQQHAKELEESGMKDEQAGHDFWLSRNGHGAGFFDRGLDEVGDKLQEAARKFGEQSLYVGDDGKLYVM